ncbi:teichoic acid transport system ATP-binding protein [Natronincola peptidivorans]|uniref:Teichoic acid transport system ATP-binding protein n=1 Tax=Natronincola peptidivorans TaxID=426128 RepID=A0A1I0CRE7_9FIRM|nr:ABC transporter ATP-binding protein [Natronincola peptidivorans]SET21883.1 teichoic acid transport system ATP-binding protein [Natronincola peptidivorans]
MDIAIEVKNLSKIYRLYEKPIDRLKEGINPLRKKYHKDFYALKDVSFNIKKGETLGILGKNGSGKSTILKIITGVLSPTLGEVKANGKIAALLELGAGFNPDYTGIENIYLNGRMMGYTKEEMDGKINNILEFADIGDFAYQPVKIYSSGMFARLAFAVSINVDPDILIVDEALSVGDVAFQTKCYKKFKEFQELGKTILFVSHSMDSILKYCTSAIVLNEGVKVEEGTPKTMVDVYKKLLSNCYENKEIKGKDLLIHQETYWKEQFTINKEMLEYGDKKAEIIDFGIFSEEGIPYTTFLHNEEVTVKMKVKFYESIEEPIFAFSIKDIKGNEICGTNTYIENIDTEVCNKGREIVISFQQKLRLQVGNYSLSFGCTKYKEDYLHIFHRLYDAFFIEVVATKKIFGIYDIESKVSLKKMEDSHD